MTTDVIVILAFVIIDFGLVMAGLLHLASRRARDDVTDARYRIRYRR